MITCYYIFAPEDFAHWSKIVFCNIKMSFNRWYCELILTIELKENKNCEETCNRMQNRGLPSTQKGGKLGRPADCIDTKLKVFRIRFTFDFKIFFVQNFVKMAPILVRFKPRIGAGFY
jgi:hypothetical protein